MLKTSLRKVSAAVALTLTGLAACGGSNDPAPAAPPAPPPAARVGDVVALTVSGQLISFNRAAPQTLVGSVVVTGLASGETLLGIDQRPADGLLYGLGSGGRLYTLDPSTGVATLKSTLRPATGDAFTALAGAEFAVDFNPAADRLRVVSDTGQNLRIHVDTGDTITDGRITPASGTASITAAAYTNSFAGTTGTALWDIDAVAGRLHLQDPPNAGGLAAGVPLGVTATAVNGFDIDGRSNTGYAALVVGATTTLYRINLAATAAAASAVGDIPAGQALRGLALMQPAAPSAIGLTTDNRLVAFDPKAPNTLSAQVAISGLSAGESVLGIDMRPSDRQLYALTNAGRLYTVDPASGAATLRSTLAADPADASAPYAGLSGTLFSVDFNPVADRLRVISELGQSLRINVDTGLTTTDGSIQRATPASVLASAYTNSFAGTATTVLYNLEANADVLTRQDPPNEGNLVDIGALGLDLNGLAGFDIAGGANGLVLAALRTGSSGPHSLYSVSLATGAVSLYRNTGDAALSRIGGAGGPALRDLAIRY